MATSAHNATPPITNNQLTVRLHGQLEDCVPATAKLHWPQELTPTITDVLIKLAIDPEQVQFALYNGQYYQEPDWQSPLPKGGGLLQLWPRIHGG